MGGVQREHQTTEKVSTGNFPKRFLYINYDDAPRWLEIFRFRYDAVLFRFWRRRAALFSSQKG